MIWRKTLFSKKILGVSSQITLREIRTGNPLRKTLYEALQIPKDASQSDIKKAYFELSKLYHPDRIEATDENLAKFREISAAYEVLSNEQSRKLYDRGLLEGITKPTTGDHKDVVEPIVQFYKKRQDFSKETLKPPEEIRSWIPPVRKHVKSKISQKYNYYIPVPEAEPPPYRPTEYFYFIAACGLTVAFLGCQLEGSNMRESYKSVKEFFSA